MASYIERNKLWLLPLLGVGAAAVVILNIRGASSSPPPPESQAQSQMEVPPVPEAPPAGTGTDLWADLKALETVPASLAQDGPIMVRSHLALGKAMDPPAPPEVPVPRPAEPELRKAQPPPVESVPAAAPLPPPEPDFVIQGSKGRRVWIDGRPFTEGQNVQDSPYRVGRIGRSRVEILGPQGTTTRSTIPHPRRIPKAHEENP